MKPEKNLGQYFTPSIVANFMIALSDVKKSAKVLEPSCGEGIFLKLLEENGYTDSVGYEVDKTLHSVTKAKIIYESFVSADIKEKYDLVIGNPPYIRWKNLDKNLKSELEKNSLWKTYFNSMSDYLCIFILKSVELLKEGGKLVFITPEYWLNTKHSQVLRNYLVKNGHFTDIIHFSETPIFNDVASSILIFKFVKSQRIPNKKINVVKYNSTHKLTEETLKKIEIGDPDEMIESFKQDQFLPQKGWILAPQKIIKELDSYEESCKVRDPNSLFGDQDTFHTLGKIADIGNGMVSGLDKAFQIENVSSLTELEKKATISVLKAKNIRQYIYKELTPYIFLNESVQSEADLREKYPHFYDQLQPWKEKLEKRYKYDRTIHYWDWVFLRSLKLFQRKTDRIFIPCKERISHKSYFRFTYVSGDIFPTQDVTAIFLKPGIRESTYYILALLNNDRVFEWLKYKGVLKGNIVEFSERPLASLPVRLIDWDNSAEKKLHDEIVSLCKKYITSSNEDTLKTLNEKVALLF